MKDLYSMQNEKECQIKSMPENSVLNSFGVYKGAKICKKVTYNVGGPVLIEVKGREVAIGKDIAMLIKVEEIA